MGKLIENFRAKRFLRELTSEMCTLKQSIMPTPSMSITAGMADNLMPSSVIAPKICTSEASTVIMTSTAAHIESSSSETSTMAANRAQTKIKASEERSVMYCSQKMKGMPGK